MFCPECGKNNPEGLKNCQYCNAELIDNSAERLSGTTVSGYVEKIKNADYRGAVQTLKSKKKMIIPIAVVIFLLIVFFILGSIMSSPERLIKKYFDSYIEQDFAKMYSCLAVSEDPFINEAAFQKYIETSTQIDVSRVSNYTVDKSKKIVPPWEKDPSANKLLKEYEITYLLDGDSRKYSQTIYLSKQSGKSWLFFDKYKVALEDAIYNNYTIRTPVGVTLEVDGIPLDGSVDKEDQNWLEYQINAIFLGEHTYKVSGDIINGYEQPFFISTSGTDTGYGYSTYGDCDLSIEDFTLNNETLDSLTQNVQTTVNTIYQGAIAGKAVNDLGIQVTEDYSDFSSMYNRIVSNAKRDDGSGLKSISFSNFQKEDASLDVEDGFEYEVEMKFNTTYVSTYKIGDTFEESSPSTPRNSKAKVTYRFEDNTWKIASIYLYSVY